MLVTNISVFYTSTPFLLQCDPSNKKENSTLIIQDALVKFNSGLKWLDTWNSQPVSAQIQDAGLFGAFKFNYYWYWTK